MDYGSTIAGEIEKDRKHKASKIGDMRACKKTDNKDYYPCICLICLEQLDMLTHCHAAKHGYKSKQEMIKAKKVKWI